MWLTWLHTPPIWCKVLRLTLLLVRNASMWTVPYLISNVSYLTCSSCATIFCNFSHSWALSNLCWIATSYSSFSSMDITQWLYMHAVLSNTPSPKFVKFRLAQAPQLVVLYLQLLYLYTHCPVTPSLPIQGFTWLLMFTVSACTSLTPRPSPLIILDSLGMRLCL